MANQLLGYALTSDEVTPGWGWLQTYTEVIYQRKEQPMNTDQTIQWAIIELMGHQQIAGRYQEAAGGMHRIDVPEADAGPDAFRFTRLYSPAAIYSITFVDEKSARLAAKMLAPRPVSVYGFEAEMRRLAAPAVASEPLECDPTAPYYADNDDDIEFGDDDDDDL